MRITAAYQVPSIFSGAANSADATGVRPITADELVAEAIRCILTGQEIPAHLRSKSELSPGLEAVQDRIAAILAGPGPV